MAKRHVQGRYDNIEGTNTGQLMMHEQIQSIPKDRTITCACIVVDYRSQKEDPNRVRITAEEI